MNPTRETDDLIRNLAAEAGAGRVPGAFRLERRLLLAAVLALGLGAVLAVVLFGSATALPAAVTSAPFLHKVASALTLAAGAFLLVRAQARPGGSGRPLAALLPGVVLLMIGAAADGSGFPVMGLSARSVPICLGAIVLLSLPALAMVLGVLRTGAPTRPTFAGTAAGLLSGALGAAAYAVACKNDGGLFVALWYSAAILIVAAIGGTVGRRVLAW